MDHKNTMKKFVGALVVGGLLLGGGGLALAINTDDTINSAAESTPPIHGRQMQGINNSEAFQSVIASLVADGTLTQEEADLIEAKQTEIRNERQDLKQKLQAIKREAKQSFRQQARSDKADFWSQLVNDGTLSQEQVTAIRNAMQAKAEVQRQTQLRTTLDNLVEKNVITSDQANTLLDKINSFMTERQKKMQEFQEMTKEQRQAYLQENQQEKVNFWTGLVNDGTLTQTQVDEICTLLPEAGNGNGMHRGGKGGGKNIGACQQNSN